VPARILLEEAGLKPSAQWAIAEGADGGSHTRSIPVSKLLDDAMLAVYQNGERLRGAQGYPLRLLLPGWEGNANVKWLHRLELSDTPSYSKDESGLYSEPLADGGFARFSFPMDVKSVITHPSGGQTLRKSGFYEIAGLAWSGHGKLSRVEVSADAGRSWAKADLSGPILSKSLTRFTIPWRWDGKPTTILSRATDEVGRVQPARTEWKSRYKDHSFNHYNAIQAWRVDREGMLRNAYA
jgi:sulfane dehydrogenase subunit SoxC